MLTKRMLAVAGVLALTVPALGAASPYLPVTVSSATPEQLVEGHTVFTVIEVHRTTEVNGTTHFAAAVAVLVREATQQGGGLRFPGVLWFNDQYLVNPQDKRDALEGYRYPCGGAVMAVNRGDPDPRMLMATARVATPAGDASAGQPASQGAGGAWANVTVDPSRSPPASASSDNVASVVVGDPSATGLSYVESYQIMDPNDHNWLIDLYTAYYRAGSASIKEMTYEYPVWVVNIMGTPAFIPDDGTLDCTPFFDTAVTPLLGQPAGNLTRSASCERLGGGRAPGGDQPIGTSGVDDPCAGYAEPSRNGHCYGGQKAPPEGCDTPRTPLRLYNAVLFFKLEHLRVAGADRHHTQNSTDTNGCHGGTPWTCPGGDDDAEGNSHPFHPHEHRIGSRESEDCVDAPQDGGNASAELPCHYRHATRDIDVYFSPHGRPMRPLVPYYAVTDEEGSDAPFHDYATSYTPTH